jgi:hypothetical protein
MRSKREVHVLGPGSDVPQPAEIIQNEFSLYFHHDLELRRRSFRRTRAKDIWPKEILNVTRSCEPSRWSLGPFTPYFMAEPWNSVAVVAGLVGLVVSFFLRPKGCG